MSFEIEFSALSEKNLKNLPKLDQEIILKKIYSIKDNPYPHLKHLQGDKLWRLRVMDYRVIIDIIVKANTIYIIRIGHRKNVYDK